MPSLSTMRLTMALLTLFAYSTRAQWENASAPDAPQWPSDYSEPDTDEAVSKLPTLPLHRLGLAIDKDITMGDVLEQDEWRAQWLAAASFENETRAMDISSSPYHNRRSQRRAGRVGHYTMMNDVVSASSPFYGRLNLATPTDIVRSRNRCRLTGDQVSSDLRHGLS
jgi:hypothetical protein